jgi:hypothetical protein
VKITVGDDTYDYDSAALTLKEARALNLQAGLELTDLLTGRFNDPRVMTAIIWLCRVRDGELKLRYDDIDIPLAKITIHWDEPEPEPTGPLEETPPDAGSGPLTVSSG